MTAADHPSTKKIGDKPGFADFYAENRLKLEQFVRRIAYPAGLSMPRLDSQDVVQDVFETALRQWDEIRLPERWIYGTAANMVRSSARRELRQERQLLKDLERLTSSWHWSGEDTVLMRIEAKIVIDQILALPTNQRIATYLYHVEGWSGTEVAELLGIGTSTAGVHIHRGTRRVRAYMGVAGKERSRAAAAGHTHSCESAAGSFVGCLRAPLGLAALVTCFVAWPVPSLWFIGGVATCRAVFRGVPAAASAVSDYRLTRRWRRYQALAAGQED